MLKIHAEYSNCSNVVNKLEQLTSSLLGKIAYCIGYYWNLITCRSCSPEILEGRLTEKCQNESLGAVDALISIAKTRCLATNMCKSLESAIAMGNVELVDRLLSAGANPNEGTPLLCTRGIADEDKRKQIFDLLEQNGASVRRESLVAEGQDRAYLQPYLPLYFNYVFVAKNNN